MSAGGQVLLTLQISLQTALRLLSLLGRGVGERPPRIVQLLASEDRRFVLPGCCAGAGLTDQKPGHPLVLPAERRQVTSNQAPNRSVLLTALLRFRSIPVERN